RLATFKCVEVRNHAPCHPSQANPCDWRSRRFYPARWIERPRPAAAYRRRYHFYEGHRANSAAELSELSPPGRCRTDAVDDLRGSASLGACHQDANRTWTSRRIDASVVHREGCRHPEIQE